ncbi:MAG: cellulase family glycosylhydrolase [Candidatus Woesebacteria bacterium]
MSKSRIQKPSPNSPAHLITILFVLMVAALLLLTQRFISAKKNEVMPSPSVQGIVNTPYISANGTKLYVNGEQYQFTGVNAFHLGSLSGTNAGCGGEEKDLTKFFSTLRLNSVVRTWAFQGGIATNVQTKQTDWSGLDRVVQAASQSGIKLILTLGEQAGTCDDGRWKDRSWYESGFAQIQSDLKNGLTPLSYLDYVRQVVSRYKDSTAIAMWEPINEPIAADCTGAKGTSCFAKQTCTDEAAATKALRHFFDTVGGAIKTIDKNHLVSSGVIGDGQCGAIYEDYAYIHQSPGIDVASYHDYGRETQAMPGDQWNGLQKRLTQMKQIGKPLIVGEVGMLAMDNSKQCMSYIERRDLLKAKMDAQFAAGIAGFIPWDLTNSTSKICNYDIVANDPTQTLLREYPVLMGVATPKPTKAPLPKPL